MSLTIDLSPDAEARLRQEAERLGLDPTEYVRLLIESRLPVGTGQEGTLALLASWAKEDATDDPNEIEARLREWEEFKRSLNSSRSSPRALYSPLS